MKWLLYGAYGYTGKLITEEAMRQNLKPVISGRDAEKVKVLAEKKELDYEIFNLKEENKINNIIPEYDILFNAAGPFKHTSAPLVKACLQHSVNYLDITGEISVFEQNFARNQKAIEKDIAIISGVGFDVVPSDCLSVYVSEKINNPIDLELGILALSQSSPGTMKTMIESIPSAVVVRRNGKLKEKTFGKDARAIKFLDKTRELYPIGWGDVATAYRSTGIPNITAYMPIPRQFENAMTKYGFIVRNLFKVKFMRKLAKRWVEKNIEGPDKQARESGRSQIWARVKNENGEEAEAWLSTIEAYRLTAISAIKSVKKIDNLNIKGSLTPAQAFGEDFILEFPDTKIIDHL
ncbi:MAG: saccharopine dehydrogenase NADP-binding domain-containing protein [Promethearchaeia archaeon]